MLHTYFHHRTPRANIAVDLGTARTIVLEGDRGIVFDEPSICCFRAYDAVPAFVAAGEEAARFVGRVAKPLKIVNPLHNGVVSDMAAARELLRLATKPVRARRRLARLRAIFGAPADATQAEKRALAVAAMDAGIGDPVIVAEPLLAAAGAGLDVSRPQGRMIVDCGAGVTEAAIISLGGICAAGSVRGGGDELTRAIVDYFRTRRRFQVGFATAERLKLEASRLMEAGKSEARLAVRGLRQPDGLPCELDVPLSELAMVWERDLGGIVTMIRRVLRTTAPELSQDISEEGIWLTGGGAHTGLLAKRIGERTGLEVRVADEPDKAVAKGLAMAMAGSLALH
jgi:rod shape-determining protein MreB